MSLFRLWRWIRAAVLELTGVAVCLMRLGSPLTQRAEIQNRTAAPTSPQSSIARRIGDHRERPDHRRLRHLLADILQEIIGG